MISANKGYHDHLKNASSCLHVLGLSIDLTLEPTRGWAADHVNYCIGLLTCAFEVHPGTWEYVGGNAKDVRNNANGCREVPVALHARLALDKVVEEGQEAELDRAASKPEQLKADKAPLAEVGHLGGEVGRQVHIRPAEGYRGHQVHGLNEVEQDADCHNEADKAKQKEEVIKAKTLALDAHADVKAHTCDDQADGEQGQDRRLADQDHDSASC